MASSSDVVKKVKRCKLQLTGTAESATIVKTLQKLKGLDITLDVLSETGIGKTVNSLRRHEQAGELAKSLVRDWKRLVPKESISHTEDADRSESLSVEDKLDDQNFPTNGSLITEDSNNNCVTSHDRSPNSSGEAVCKTGSQKADSEEQYEEQKSHKDQNENYESSQQVLKKDLEIQEDQGDTLVISKKKRSHESNRKSGDTDTFLRNKNSVGTHQKSSSHDGRFGSEKELNKKPKELFSFEPKNKHSDTLKRESVRDNRASETSRGSEAPDEKRKKMSKERHSTLKFKQESETKRHSKNKKAKLEHKYEKSDSEEPSLSFESYLNYDANVCKRKEKSGVKKRPKTTKTLVKQEATKGPGSKPFRSPVMSINATSPTQVKESVMDLMPLPAVLPDCEKRFSVEYSERKVETESNFCDISEEFGVFTGQRLNKKMQVYSGAKTVFLPVMLSLHQQCIRTLQNNINLLYETGGVPFEILEPVLERCTPEQLLRIEECNPVYIGETDHLWGKHCQRDFKHSKLEEYESWKEMYVRLSEERERKLKRLTKSIVSAHSSKPKGRQVKMAFIHTVAKPPRDVRIQQEIHGTAVQQPQLKCSIKVQDSQPGPSCNEPSRPSSTGSGATNTQDPRKKTRVAPMMAKSLKAFKKQLGRR